MVQHNGSENTRQRSSTVWQKIWKIFSSPFLAIILMLILVALSLIGSLVIQVPAEYKIDLNNYSAWLQNIAQPQTGFWYPFLNAFGLFDVFHTPLFLGTGSLLVISIIICSLSRLKPTLSNISLSPVRKNEDFYLNNNSLTEPLTSLSPQGSAGAITRALKKRHYTIRSDTSTNSSFITADKNRFSPLGVYVVHLSIILFIAGYLIGSFGGFKENSFIVPEEVTRDIGHNTGLSIQLHSFTSTFWPDGSPQDYKSEVSIYRDQQEVTSGTIQVNHPLSYDGVRIYQSFYGPATQIQINQKDEAGNSQLLYKGNVALDGILANHPYQRPSGGFRLIQEGYVIFFVGRSTNITDTVLGEGQIGMEIYKTDSNTPVASTKLDKDTPYTVEGLEITYLGDASFSGFQVSRDPGNNLIWIASGLLLLGLVAVFYFPRRRIWAWIQEIPGKPPYLRMRTDSNKKPGTASELQSMLKEIKTQILKPENLSK